ncbi:MAG TPA: rhomboid family intramembrane serine protease [Gemmatimonadales bacterium]|nr:rhomboid family intramembrane serine protease [Gemmatimonadales bacterium]
MLPIRDENPTLHPPVVTYGLIAANIAIWILLQGMGNEPALSRSVCSFGLFPAELLGHVAPGTEVQVGPGQSCAIGGSPRLLSILTSMFTHGSWFHVLGNMWFLHVFGNNVEDVMGHFRFLVFYLLGGLAAALAQVFTGPDSTIPMIGASGAIGSVMGSYALLYPRVGIRTFVFLGFWAQMVVIPAVFMLGYWFVIQLASGALAPGEGGGVAFWAHVGGFLTGICLTPVFRNSRLLEAHRAMAAAR